MWLAGREKKNRRRNLDSKTRTGGRKKRGENKGGTQGQKPGKHCQPDMETARK